MVYCQMYWIFFSFLIIQLLCYGITGARTNSFSNALNSLKLSGKKSFKRALSEDNLRSRRDLESFEHPFEDTRGDENEDLPPFYVGPVCELIDVRNTPHQLRDLENCTIVNGFVHILFINDHPKQKQYNLTKYSFPKLRVITEYLLIYRVYGLASLRKLFPNLIMIGGLSLFHNYALLLYENPQLTENPSDKVLLPRQGNWSVISYLTHSIVVVDFSGFTSEDKIQYEQIGLSSLQYIRRGTVRIQNNGRLCFLNTVNWGLLGKITVQSYPDIMTGYRRFLLDKAKNQSIKIISRYYSTSRPCQAPWRTLCHHNCLSIITQRNNDIRQLIVVAYLNGSKESGNHDIEKPVFKDNKFDSCIDQCGNGSACTFENENGVLTPYCWGVNLCQKQPYICNSGTKCVCHPQCLGGCYAPDDASACHACKNLYHNLTCVASCPNNTFLADKWQCVESDYCAQFGLVLHDGECLSRCPPYHLKKQKLDSDSTYVIHTCEKCDGSCEKICDFVNPYTVTNKLTLGAIRRCTILNTQLVLSVTGADLEEALLDALGVLQQVDSLVVRRSEYLTSLSFLRSLKYITGKKSYLDGQDATDDGYSVYVVDNKRLRDLWDVDKGESTLRIGGGKAFFHFNPVLCLDKIQKIANLTKAVEDSNDISQSTNGDRITCNMKPIENVTIQGDVDPEGAWVIIKWKVPEIDDYRTLIGFHVHFKKSVYENATRFDEDDSGKTSWSIKDVDRYPAKDEEDRNSLAFIHDLTPYTKYAFFIATITTSAIRQGAQSDILYYTTKPSKPSVPRYVSLDSVNSSAISISWEPPSRPNGNITHYKVQWKPQEDDTSVVNAVNTCNQFSETYPYNKPSNQEEDSGTKQPLKNETTDPSTGDCSCDKKPKKTESDFLESQTFEDYMINNLIHGREFPDELMEPEAEEVLARRTRSADVAYARYRRSLNTTSLQEPSNKTLNSLSSLAVVEEPSTTNPAMYEPEERMESVEVWNSTSITLTGLHYFTEYHVEVVACNHASDTIGCGTASISTRRTKKSDTADKIPSKIRQRKDPKNQKLILSWEPPPKPNSFIKLYHIYFTKQSETKEEHCCSAMVYNPNKSCALSVVGLPPGTYQVRVQPVSLAANGTTSHPIDVVIEKEPTGWDTTLMRILIIVAAVSVLPFAVALYFIRRRYLHSKQPPIYASVNPEYSSIGVYEPDEYEIAPEDIELIREIGQGHFGKVYEGLAQKVVKDQSETRVAIKTLHGNETVSKRMEFLKEASVMKQFNSHHVVRLLGVVSTTNRPMVVMEYMEQGDLKTYLRSTRPDAEDRRGEPPSLQQKLQMCGEIADGMAYLAANKFVHRDLAARNCLVHQDMTVKIGDFGLTRDVYETDYYRIDSRGILPVRWMAPESLKDGVFDSRSDVWSYGVVLWEISTLAEQPYQGQQHDQVTRFVIDGGYMEQPKECPKKLYDLMLMCWEYSPGMRPTFMEIVTSLSPDLSDQFKQVSFFNEPKEGDDFPTNEDMTEDDPFFGGSLPSTNGLTLSNGSSENESVHPVRNNGGDNYLHLNGGHHVDPIRGGRGDSLLDKEDTIRYVSSPVKSHLNSTTIC